MLVLFCCARRLLAMAVRELSNAIPACSPSVAEKIARLKKYAAEHGSLDGPDGPQQLVMLDSGEIVSQRRPTIQTLPKTD